jgi:AcrR family transcriptional regulator
MTLCRIPDKWGAKERAIFHNAKRIIAKYGLSWVTLDDIARGYKEEEGPQPNGAGSVSKAMVRKIFISKEQLLQVITDTAWKTITEKVEQIFGSNDAAIEKLRKLLNEIPRLLLEDLDACGVLVRERYPQKMQQGKIRGSADALRCLVLLEKVLRGIRKEGHLRKDIRDIPSVVHCLYGALENGMLNIYISFIDNIGDSEVKKLVDANRRVDNLILTLKAMMRGVLKDFDL